MKGNVSQHYQFGWVWIAQWLLSTLSSLQLYMSSYCWFWYFQAVKVILNRIYCPQIRWHHLCQDKQHTSICLVHLLIISQLQSFPFSSIKTRSHVSLWFFFSFSICIISLLTYLPTAFFLCQMITVGWYYNIDY